MSHLFHQAVVLDDITGHLGGKAGGWTTNESLKEFEWETWIAIVSFEVIM